MYSNAHLHRVNSAFPCIFALFLNKNIFNAKVSMCVLVDLN